MQTSIDQTHWYDRLWAALIFFTRLPFWRLYQPSRECYARVVEWWPLTGWLTGGVMAATLWTGSMFLPSAVAVVLAVVVRLLLTGALHEDGLADFLDGFGGGGSDRQRILAIMKDSHIGTYGVLGLIAYFALLVTLLLALNGQCSLFNVQSSLFNVQSSMFNLQSSMFNVQCSVLAILAADPFAKMVTAQLILMLPYARREEEAKSKTVYRRFSVGAGISLAVQGMLPMVVFLWLTGISWELVVFAPCFVMYLLYLLMLKKIGGYTGDCCGAVFLLVELTVYLVVCAHLSPLTTHLL